MASKKLNEIIGENLTFLRKKAGLTQYEFGEKFAYSDKTVSRWEQGDVIPSVETLKQIADFYEVSVDFLLSEHSKEKDFFKIIKNTPNYTNKIIIVALILTILLAIGVTVYIASIYNLKTVDPNINRYWVVFLWLVPISFLIMTYCTRRIFHSKKWTIIHLSSFVWTLLLAAYITFLYMNNYWYLFFIGLPFQAALILMYNLK